MLYYSSLARVASAISLLSTLLLCGTASSVGSVLSRRQAPNIPKAVFAHHIVGNTYSYTTNDWANDITKAKSAGIDAFVLNIGAQTSYTDTQLANAYAAAEQNGFKLFLSFDYAAQGAWSISSVVSTINAHKGSAAQFKVNGLPLVSTFEGPDNSGDWPSIRSQVGGIFFLPDWTSKGPDAFHNNLLQYTDGAFSWDAWPQGATDMTTTSDKAWYAAVQPKAYMMPVSPWFYTNLPPDKNWLWRGDDMWHTRWQQVLQIKPNFVEIISWNDYGESHYIGPIINSGVPSGAHKYVDNMPHEHWRDLLPYYIAAYKTGQSPTVTADKVHFWYRLSPAAAGSNDNTAGNAPYQPYTDPNQVVQDKVFFTALITSPSTVSLQIGNGTPVTFSASSAGAFHSSTPFNGKTGTVTIKVIRNGSTVVSATGTPIVASPANGKTNYNAWVGGSG